MEIKYIFIKKLPGQLTSSDWSWQSWWPSQSWAKETHSPVPHLKSSFLSPLLHLKSSYHWKQIWDRARRLFALRVLGPPVYVEWDPNVLWMLNSGTWKVCGSIMVINLPLADFGFEARAPWWCPSGLQPGLCPLKMFWCCGKNQQPVLMF